MCFRQNSGRAWNSLFFAVVWSVWEVRNNLVFKEVQPDFCCVVDSVRFRIGWWFKHLGRGSSNPITLILLNIVDRCSEEPKKKRAVNFQNWKPPANSNLLFFVDGSVRGVHGQTGIGGVLRDQLGKVLCLSLHTLVFKTSQQQRLWLSLRLVSC